MKDVQNTFLPSNNQKKILNEDFFHLLYQQNKNELILFAKRYVHTEHIAQDIVQDVFTKLWDKKEELNHIVNLRAYLFKMVKNRTLDDLKKIKRIDLMPEEMIKEFKHFDDGIENLSVEREYFEFLKSQFDRLPETSKKVFILCREMGKTYEEASTELNISKNTVKHHMVATVKWLKQEVLAKLNISNGIGASAILFVSKYLPDWFSKSL